MRGFVLAVVDVSRAIAAIIANAEPKEAMACPHAKVSIDSHTDDESLPEATDVTWRCA